MVLHSEAEMFQEIGNDMMLCEMGDLVNSLETSRKSSGIKIVVRYSINKFTSFESYTKKWM